MSVLSIRGLARHYGDVPALVDFDLDVAPGSRTAIVGHSGSGKTTLLRLVAGFETPDAGEVRLDGELLAGVESLVPPNRRNIGLVMQEGALFPHLSVLDNIRFGIRDEPDQEARALSLLDLVELDRSLAGRFPHQLSGGQQQRVALARALARRPRLMLLDEPFSALDAGLREHLRRATTRILAESGVATLLVTHDRDEAMEFADQLVVLRRGRAVQIGNPARLYHAPADLDTALFLGPAIVLPARGEGLAASCALGNVVLSSPALSAGQILLRPEQIEISAANTATAVSAWSVEQASQLGARVELLLTRLHEGDRAEIILQVPAFSAPTIGTGVNLRVVGPAHPLPEQEKLALAQ